MKIQQKFHVGDTVTIGYECMYKDHRGWTGVVCNTYGGNSPCVGVFHEGWYGGHDCESALEIPDERGGWDYNVKDLVVDDANAFQAPTDEDFFQMLSL